MMIGYFPSIIARKGHAALKIITPYFKKYYDNALDSNANDFIKGRARVSRKYGFSNEAMAKFDLLMIYAATTNAVPSTFWMILFLFSRPDILTQVRKEVDGNVTRKTVNGTEIASFDITSLEKTCPLLAASFYETQRLVSAGVHIRFVSQDTMLDRYLLKKGSIIQMPVSLLHKSANTWGPDFDQFHPHRFLQDGMSRERRKVQAQNFLPFGGGKHLCPGRHLAFIEIVSFVAILVHGYDATMGDESKRIEIPQPSSNDFGIFTKRPATDVKLLIKRREEMKDFEWAFFTGNMETASSE